MNRRALLTGIGALLAAPALVRASSLMAVKPWALELNEASLEQALIEIRNYEAEFELRGLAFSFNEFKEIVCANILNNATTQAPG